MIQWKEKILAEADKRGQFFLNELLPRGHSWSAWTSLHRAALTLRDQGRLYLKFEGPLRQTKVYRSQRLAEIAALRPFLEASEEIKR